ncbi:polyphenol oxidase family protein, partial [Hydrogenivirga sp. 128-5-R1-1]|uniref:polyphenol oxidase family protein n=1 Tax=Hydrogenivirga sp. 128-5-R1-1 TaxID=392423 RepID=UPI00015EF153
KVKGKLIEIKTEWKEHPHLYLPIQKHTNRVITLTRFPFPPTIGDAVVTNLKGVEIGVRTADCVPLVLVGDEWVGVVHVGWKGLAAGVVEKTLDRLKPYEELHRLFAFIGPSAKSCCYEVGEEFRRLFPSYLAERNGSLYMDMQRAVMEELRSMGINNFGLIEKCTVCSEDLPSYRRDRTERRLLTSVRIL